MINNCVPNKVWEPLIYTHVNSGCVFMYLLNDGMPVRIALDEMMVRGDGIITHAKLINRQNKHVPT